MNILLLYSTGGTNRDIFLNTNFEYLIKSLDKINGVISKIRFHKIQQLYHMIKSPYESLSYVNDWKESFERLKNHNVTSINILNQTKSNTYLKKNITNFDLIILLHSALGDNIELINPYKSLLLNRKGKLLSFVGNEFNMIREKKNFLKQIDVDFVCSQLPQKAFEFLYNDLEAKLIPAPHALNHNFYIPSKYEKNLDISFVGGKYPLFIGDQERNLFIDYCSDKKSNLNNHISFGRNKNVPRHIWKQILQNTKFTIGAEAGTYYLDKNGELLQKAIQYCNTYPKATLQELENQIFKNHSVSYVNGKAISSRHFEPIGTKTCQILLEGHYNGILNENEHYISVRKDYSNFDEAFERYIDPKEREEITENAYEYVIENHTYDIRIKSILNQIK